MDGVGGRGQREAKGAGMGAKGHIKVFGLRERAVGVAHVGSTLGC